MRTQNKKTDKQKKKRVEMARGEMDDDCYCPGCGGTFAGAVAADLHANRRWSATENSRSVDANER